MTYELNEHDFSRGFWYHRPEDNFPPPALFHLDASYSKSRLTLAETPGSRELSDYQRKKIITSWEDILPSLDSVEMLWVAPKVNQSLFDAICNMPNLRGLWIKHSNVKSIDSAKLQGLEFLHLGSSTSLGSIGQLSKIENLKWLETENLKQIKDFSPLSRLEQLVGLGINGSMWTTQRVDSLAPFSNLFKLRYVSLANTRVKDNSLKPLHNLKRLETLHIAQWWPEEEVIELKKAIPNLRT